jgi:hypothetical protein
MRITLSVALLAVTFSGASLAPADTGADSQPVRPETTPLRETAKLPSFAQDGWFAWREPVQCDESGNLFLVPVPPADTRIPANEQKRHDVILRVSRDGKERTTIDPSQGSYPGAAEAVTVATTVDSAGNLHVLLWIPGEQSSFRIATYDNAGKYRSSTRIDPEEIQVGSFEVFGSGAYLLVGLAGLPPGEARFAVMESSGALRDVLGIADDPTQEREGPKRPALMARGGDGLVYTVLDGKSAVHVVDPSAESRLAFALEAAPRDWRLVGLKAAGNRLAFIYHQEPANADKSGVFWLAVYDPLSGERQATYGPVDRPPLCYSRPGDGDTFTIFDSKHLRSMAP